VGLISSKNCPTIKIALDIFGRYGIPFSLSITPLLLLFWDLSLAHTALPSSPKLSTLPVNPPSNKHQYIVLGAELNSLHTARNLEKLCFRCTEEDPKDCPSNIPLLPQAQLTNHSFYNLKLHQHTIYSILK
jgi:hypothetical protein